MEFGINEKKRIAWICHFSSEKIQQRLPIWKKTHPFGAWILNTIEGFENCDEFELHVISPHQYLKRDFSFIEKNVHYYFFKVGIPIINRSWPTFFDLDLKTGFFFNKRKIRNIINQVQPQLINLQGAENAYYSSSVLELYKKYPVLVSIQGFVSLETFVKPTPLLLNRIDVEKKIIEKLKYFGGDVDSQLLITKMREVDFDYFRYYYPNGSNIDFLAKKAKEKEYDLLFWARIVKDKGAEDFLFIVAKLKEDFPNIQACVIGPVAEAYLDFLKNKAVELNCENNINFIGFIENSEMMYAEVLKAKILVLPTYNDRFPTVLREAVCLKIAVISYSTGSIPNFNDSEERILLTQIGDVDSLVVQAKKLLIDRIYFDELTQKAFDHGVSEFSIESNCNKLKDAYKSILIKERNLKK